MALAIEITDQEPGVGLAMFLGRLDTLTAPQLETALAPLLDSSAVTLIAFGPVRAGVHQQCRNPVPRAGDKALGARGGRVVIVNPQSAVRKVPEIVKALPPEQVFGSEAELDAISMPCSGRSGETCSRAVSRTTKVLWP